MMRNRVNFFALSIFEGQPLNSCVLNVAHLAVKDKRSPPGSFQDRFCSDYEKQVSKIGSVNTWILNLYCVFWITEIRMEDERGHTRSRDSQQSSEHCKCKDSMWKCTAETVVTVKQITPEQLSEKNKSFIQIMLYPHTFTSSFQKKKKKCACGFCLSLLVLSWSRLFNCSCSECVWCRATSQWWRLTRKFGLVNVWARSVVGHRVIPTAMHTFSFDLFNDPSLASLQDLQRREEKKNNMSRCLVGELILLKWRYMAWGIHT